MKTWLTQDQVAERYCQDARTINKWCNNPKMEFPQPRKLGARTKIWDLDELKAWLEIWEQFRPSREERWRRIKLEEASKRDEDLLNSSLGELQWLEKARTSYRNLRRVLRNPEVLRSLREASKPANNSRS